MRRYYISKGMDFFVYLTNMEKKHDYILQKLFLENRFIKQLKIGSKIAEKMVKPKPETEEML